MPATDPTAQMPLDGGFSELSVGELVAGGSALGRLPDGEVTFVDGALPGEMVWVEVGRSHSGWREGWAREIRTPSPDRVTPACPHVADGCGGCDLAYAAAPVQPVMKRAIVTDALRRIGKLDGDHVEALVEAGEPAPRPDGHRTTVRAVIVDGRAALRKRASHDTVLLDSCRVAHPLVEEVLLDGRFGDANEIAVRAGAATGERLVVVDPATTGVSVPAGVIVVGEDELASGRKAWYHEEVGGMRWRVSARSFFQSSHAGAEALAADVLDLARPRKDTAVVLDAFAGVGVLGGLVREAIRAKGGDPRLVAVEQSGSSIRDARHNLGKGGEVLRVSVDQLKPLRSDLIIADPSRRGLGRDAVHRLSACGSSVLVLVSCDPASLGRDAALLATVGYRLVKSRLVDMFPQTSHVEVVSRFERGGD